ncbi:MAG: hypothetical protein HGB36_13855 [Chlorobiaceae bacterium]|nr:hypothetical protein [Chlorobiaceae bacterium]
MEDELKIYRQGLIDTQRKLNESYDKLLITLSGGALGLSVTFLKDIIGSNEIRYPNLLLIAWALFVTSIGSILCEILFGIQAHKKAIKQVDDKTIYVQKVGGKSSNWTTIFHWMAALSLISGLMFVSSFAFLNLGGCYVGEKNNTKAPAESTNQAVTPERPKAVTSKGTKAIN